MRYAHEFECLFECVSACVGMWMCERVCGWMASCESVSMCVSRETERERVCVGVCVCVCMWMRVYK